MQRRSRISLVWLVVLLCYLIPFTFLSQTHTWYGSFLFWTLAGVIVIAINVYVTSDFKDQ